MGSPADAIIEERDVMVSPNDGDPFLKKAYFLKPTAPISSIDLEPPFELPQCFSSLPPKEWHLKVSFRGWRLEQNDWRTWVDHMASLHQSTWKRAGIHEAVINSTFEIKRKTNSVYGLSEKWCCETNTFVFPWGEASITLEDILILGGFSVLGDSVFSSLDSSIELKEIQEKLEKERSELYKSTSKNATESLWLKKFRKSGSELEHQAFLAFWLSRYVFPEACNVIHKRVFPIAILLARGTRIALAPAVLACIYRDLSVLKRAIVSSNELKGRNGVSKLKLKSPFHLVQVWAWERFLEFRPVPNVISYAEPRLALWNRVDGLKVVNVRTVLESAGESFVWRPYAMPIENWNFPKFYTEKEKWVGPGLEDELLSFVMCLRATELAGLDTREQYLPHRVARQFGYDQDFPSSVARSGHSSDEPCVEVNSDGSWKDCIEEMKNVKLYIPSRMSKADISTRYLKWWKESVSVLKNKSEPTMPKLKKAKCMEGSLPRAKHVPIHHGSAPKKVVEGCKRGRKTNGFTIPSVSYSKFSEKIDLPSEPRNQGTDSLVPPGFPPRCRIEDGGSMDEDRLTLSDIFGCYMNHKKVETRTCGDSEKLSDQVQNLASSPAETSVDTMKSEGLKTAGPLDEDRLTLSELFKNYTKHKNVEIRTCGDSEKLSGQVQNLASSTAESSVDTIKSERLETEDMLNEVSIGRCKAKRNLTNVIGSNATSSDSDTASILLENWVSALKNRVSRLESIVGVLRANSSGNDL
ncbi:uncharacterized protein LOC133733013 [Rosa rugosa]|uniref:uncharacterized protein LOC133733013 n=1 Tax=Rosa rugosa TaxID=74645 RepID=UPI002B40FCD0|nr:uncharacterized protein LOC133733013 [Rosa rugosa]XP_062016604.1 uncharacterized protein LOC133733013 [Rosa rugosa]